MFAARNPINAWPGSQRFNGVPLVMSGQRHSQFALRFIDILRKQGAPFGLIETAQTASPVVLQDCLSAEQLLLLRGAVPRAVHTLRFPHGFSDGQTELSEAGAAAVAVGGGGEEKGERDGCRLEAAVARTAEGHTKLLTDLLSPPEGGGGAVVTFWMSPENRLCVVGNVLQSSPPNLFQQLWLLPSLVLELLCHQPRAVVAQHIEGWERHARGLSFYVGGFALGLPYREASGVVWSLAEEGKKPLVASRAALFSAFYLLVHRMLAADGVPLAFVDGLFLTAWEALCSSSSSSSAGASGVAAEDTHIASFFAVPSGPGAVAAAAAAPSSLVNSSLYRQQQLRGSIRRCVDLVVRVRALLRGSAAPSSDDICALQLGCLLSAAQASAVPERRPAFISLEHADVIQRAVREKRRAWQANHYEAVNERQAMEKLVSHAMWSSAADLRRFIQQAPTSDLRYVVIRDTTAASLVFSLEKLFPLGSFFVAEMFSEAGRCYQALLVLTADMLWIYQRYSMSRFLSSPSIAPGLRPVLWQPLPFAPTLFQCLSSSVPLHRRIGVMILRDLLGFTRLPRLPTALASSAGIVQSCDKVAAFVLRLARLACEAPRSAGAVEDFMAVAVTVLSMAAAFVAPVDKLEVDMEQLLEAGPIDVGFVAKLREAEKCGLAGFALWEHVIDGLQDAAQSFDRFAPAFATVDCTFTVARLALLQLHAPAECHAVLRGAAQRQRWQGGCCPLRGRQALQAAESGEAVQGSGCRCGGVPLWKSRGGGASPSLRPCRAVLVRLYR